MTKSLTCEYLFVLDRCIDDSETICINNNIPYIINDKGIGRQCGLSRNLGVAYFPNDDILFLDGDRLPNFDVNLLDQSPFDLTLVKCETDIRDNLHKGSWIADKLWGTFNNGVFGSCLLVRRNVLDSIFAKYGHLFDVDFVRWGEEDRHFGDLAYSVGATCGFADNNMRVSGSATICHERMDDFMAMTTLRVNKLFALGLDNLLCDSNFE